MLFHYVNHLNAMPSNKKSAVKNIALWTIILKLNGNSRNRRLVNTIY